MRRFSGRFLFVLVLALVGSGTAYAKSGFTQQDLSVSMDDGVSLATTLYKPDGTPPTDG